MALLQGQERFYVNFEYAHAIVTLTFESLGECGRVTPQISQTSVIRGDFLEVTFPQAAIILTTKPGRPE